MILSELRNYLQQQQRVSLRDLANHFHSNPDALRGMLQKWINKGKIIKVDMGKACGTSCCKCDAAMTEIYEWRSNTPIPLNSR